MGEITKAIVCRDHGIGGCGKKKGMLKTTYFLHIVKQEDLGKKCLFLHTCNRNLSSEREIRNYSLRISHKVESLAVTVKPG